MLEVLKSVFKSAPYNEMKKVMEVMHFLLDMFDHEKLVDGHNSRDSAIDCMISLLQSEKSK